RLDRNDDPEPDEAEENGEKNDAERPFGRHPDFNSLFGGTESSKTCGYLPEAAAAVVCSHRNFEGVRRGAYASEPYLATLVDISGTGRREYALGPVTTLGRDPANSIAVTDPSVSRRHASIRRTPDGKYLLVDLGSTHGTYVAGRRTSEKVLA